MTLTELKNVPFSLSVLSSLYPDLKSISEKAIEMEKAGKIIRLKRGLYTVSPQSSGLLLSECLIANHIYGPSYVSLETALRFYGLIPERVTAIRSMTTKHTRRFVNQLGIFEYKRCNHEYFNIGIRLQQQGDIIFMIATPEKALCDLLTTMPTTDIRFIHELNTFLTDNLRLDMDAFHSMHKEIFEQCAEIGKKKSLITKLIKLI